jgi:MFS transporter, MHS family, proline/betaine transporter
MNIPKKFEIKTVALTFSLWAISGFDLLLISIVSVEIQRLYFPTDNPQISILAIYGTLSLSLLARVFGGLFFGQLADKHGRQPIITLCLLTLSITMIVSAFLPSVYT